MTARERAQSHGPHKILTLDGGGIRGALTIEVLAEIESIVASKGYATLADYFDYISGTSTGAILATGLSLGWKVDRLRSFYHEHGERMFAPASFFRKFKYRYEDDNLAETLKKELKGKTLGDDAIQTLLMVVMRNATTDSPWPVSNNPFAKYNDINRTDCNLQFPLWQLVRASTAAPIFFPPEKVRLGEHEFLFVDGGVTCYNNPSFQTFLMATAEPYHLNWQTGRENLLLVSVGTGMAPDANARLSSSDMNHFYNASRIPSALMYAASNEQDFLCRVFGDCIHGDPIDREIGDMCSSGNSLCGGPSEKKLFTYTRYNAILSDDGLDSIGVGNIDIENIKKMDAVENIEELARIGSAIAKTHVKKKHFKHFD